MNIDILKLLKKQNDKALHLLNSKEISEEQKYLYENVLVANKRRYLYEFNTALCENL